jgi:acyl carrier protein
LDGKIETVLGGVLQMPAQEIRDDLAMSDVEAWDSLRHMELIVVLEQAYGVDLTFDEIVTMQSVAQIKRVLRERGVLG